MHSALQHLAAGSHACKVPLQAFLSSQTPAGGKHVCLDLAFSAPRPACPFCARVNAPVCVHVLVFVLLHAQQHKGLPGNRLLRVRMHLAEAACAACTTLAC